MKLLSLTSKYYFLSILIIVILGGFVSYEIIKSIINNQLNERLTAEKEQLIIELNEYESLKYTYFLNIGDKISIDSLESNVQIVPTLKDTLVYDTFEKKEMRMRQISFSAEVDGQNYLITISKSLLSTQELIKGIGEIMLSLMVGLILSLVLVNRLISKKIWRPFYETLNFLKSYKITKPKKIIRKKEKIEEFRQLNLAIEAMISKSLNDYLTLKEFNENASHEIQTPLAIIKAKCELLLQDNLTDQQLTEVSSIYSAITRLSKLNHSLVLLAKIDNNQYMDVEPIDLQSFIENKIEQFEELIKLKQLKLQSSYMSRPFIKVNDTLAYILFSNLFSNAVKHNTKNGYISITLDQDFFMIKNSGNILMEKPEKYFQRFKRSTNSADSSGLGLTLVKRICDLYNFRIHYTNHNNEHRITIYF